MDAEIIIANEIFFSFGSSLMRWYIVCSFYCVHKQFTRIVSANVIKWNKRHTHKTMIIIIIKITIILLPNCSVIVFHGAARWGGVVWHICDLWIGWRLASVRARPQKGYHLRASNGGTAKLPGSNFGAKLWIIPYQKQSK